MYAFYLKFLHSYVDNITNNYDRHSQSYDAGFLTGLGRDKELGLFKRKQFAAIKTEFQNPNLVFKQQEDAPGQGAQSKPDNVTQGNKNALVAHLKQFLNENKTATKKECNKKSKLLDTYGVYHSMVEAVLTISDDLFEAYGLHSLSETKIYNDPVCFMLLKFVEYQVESQIRAIIANSSSLQKLLNYYSDVQLIEEKHTMIKEHGYRLAQQIRTQPRSGDLNYYQQVEDAAHSISSREHHLARAHKIGFSIPNVIMPLPLPNFSLETDYLSTHSILSAKLTQVIARIEKLREECIISNHRSQSGDMLPKPSVTT